MTGRLTNLVSPIPIMRLGVIPLLALVALLVTGDSVHAAGAFNPVNVSRLCKQDAAASDAALNTGATTFTATIDCVAETAPGSHPDVLSKFNIGLGPDNRPITPDDTGDYNFGGVVGLSPSSPTDADVPDGAILGKLRSKATLGLIGNPCTNGIDVAFTFMEGTTDINNTVDMSPYGINNDLGPLTGDPPPYEGNQTENPPPAATKYPSFLNAIFDKNWVGPGPDKIPGNDDDIPSKPTGIKPRFRFVGVSWISQASLWVVLQGVVFEPGTKLPSLPAIDAAYGYPSVTVLQTASAAGNATPPAPSAITDFCSPLKVDFVSYGIAQDNPATPANESGAVIRTMPEAGAADACTKAPPGPGCIVGFNYGPSQRDADGDGYENSLDPCPFNADTEWNPRDLTPAVLEGDTDTYNSGPSPDGIPNTCDPTVNDPTSANGEQPSDHDGDRFLNRGDNCPLHYNPSQDDKDVVDGEETGDGIGDACDTPGTEGGNDCVTEQCGGPSCPGGLPPCPFAGPNAIPAKGVAGKGPATPDGEAILCIKVNTVISGGDANVAYSPCLAALPDLSVPLPPTTSDPGAQTTGTTGTTGTTARTGAGTGAGGGPGGPVTGIGSLSPVAGTVPAWAAIAGGLGVAGLIGSFGTLASRLVRRRRDD